MHSHSGTPTSGEATPTSNEGLVPISCLKQPPGGLKATNIKELDLGKSIFAHFFSLLSILSNVTFFIEISVTNISVYFFF
jgi:hypothetical protein